MSICPAGGSFRHFLWQVCKELQSSSLSLLLLCPSSAVNKNKVRCPPARGLGAAAPDGHGRVAVQALVNAVPFPKPPAPAGPGLGTASHVGHLTSASTSRAGTS